MERLWRDYGEISNLAVMHFWEIAEHSHHTLTRWDRNEDAAYPHLREIAQPVFVASGSNDLIIPTVNAIVLAQRLPKNALLTIYPDSGHGFLFQYHTLFGEHATLFLDT